jgi:hypothetical protein
MCLKVFKVQRHSTIPPFTTSCTDTPFWVFFWAGSYYVAQVSTGLVILLLDSNRCVPPCLLKTTISERLRFSQALYVSQLLPISFMDTISILLLVNPCCQIHTKLDTQNWLFLLTSEFSYSTSFWRDIKFSSNLSHVHLQVIKNETCKFLPPVNDYNVRF